MTDEDETNGEAIIPEEDFREAIAACRQDPLLDRYFKLAPQGAKLFIGLGFYSTHFGDKVDPRQYAECQAEIEPALTETDLKYLIRFEEDKATKRYLRGLLARREEEARLQGAPAEEPAPIRVSPDEIPAVPRRRRVKRASASGLQWIMRKDAVRWLPFACKSAALLAVLIGGGVFLAQNWHRLGATDEEPAGQEEGQIRQIAQDEAPATNATEVAAASTQSVVVAEVPTPAEPSAEPPPPSETPASAVSPERTSPAVACRGDADGADGADEERRPSVAAAKEPSEKETRKSTRRSRVVFTDGRKIVRHPGGKIEVPRVFSCAGAGIKPLWVYGANPEIEAAKEQKARREWLALVEQAKAAGAE